MSAKHSILIVEGSRTQAERLRLVLQAHHYLVSVVTDGGNALAAAREQQPSLILSGVALSGMDGYDMCAALKQDHEVKHIPVVLLTAVTDVEDLLRGLNAQVDYYIAKPYQEEELVSRISAIMEGLVQEVGQPGREQLTVLLRGERRTLTPDRLRLLRLLLSTYENYSSVLRQARALSTTQLQLKARNQHLQEECERLHAALEKPQAVPAASSSSTHAETAREAENVPRVLVAEDTVICRTMLARFLEKLGRRADVVATGADAVEAFHGHAYTAVLMDIQMPIMGGFEAAARIRQHEKASGGHVPIIAITAHGDPGDRERCLAAGMDDYLAKPVTLAALKRVLGSRPSQVAVSPQDTPAFTSTRERG